MPTTSPFATRSLFAAAVLATALAGCRRSPGIALEAPSGDAERPGTAPVLAVSPSGATTMAWVNAPDGGTDGRLYLATGSAAPAVLRDSLGAVQVHGEAPPKIAYAPDGALLALYVVPRVVPGRRFPLGALRLVRSTDGGRTWSAPVTVTDDSTFGAHNFQSLHAGPDGALYAAWLDGREGKSAARVSASTDGGATWSASRRADMGEACPCCRTTLATGRDGTLYLAWRKVYPGNVRDVVVARSTDHGATWSEPVPVHRDEWVYDGCPHAGPALGVDSAGHVHVAWWTGKEGRAGVWYARSDDGGRSFGEPVAIGVAEYSRPAHAQLALGGDGAVLVAWDDGTLQRPRVMLRLSRDGGRTFRPALAASAEGRAATFPVVALHGDRLTVAWTEEGSAPAPPEDAQREEHMEHDGAMKHGGAPSGAMGALHAVGASRVVVREGVLR